MEKELFLHLAIYLVSMAATAGTVLWRISALEKKVEKHNDLVGRMYRVEENTKSAHKRLDRMEGTQ